MRRLNSGGFMKFKGLFANTLALLTVAGMAACAPNSQSSAVKTSGSDIVGGTAVAADDQIAQMTAILYDTKQSSLCTVSIVSDEWVLTAGHCVENSTAASLVVIFTNDINQLKAGSSSADLAQSPLAGKTRRVLAFTQNPGYKATMDKIDQMDKDAKAKGGDLTSADIDNVKDWGDVTLIHLAGKVPSGYHAAKMLDAAHTFAKGDAITLAGYGISSKSNSDSAGTLRQVDVTVAESVWGTSEILFDQTNGKGACHGDSGGPAYVKNSDGTLSLFGVTSRGVRDDADSCVQFAAYTNMQHYTDWMKQVSGL